MVISTPTLITYNPVLATTSSSTPLPTISTTPSAPSTIGQAGNDGDFTTQAALGSLTARPTNNMVNTNSFYDVVFLTATAEAIKQVIIRVVLLFHFITKIEYHGSKTIHGRDNRPNGPREPCPTGKNKEKHYARRQGHS